MNQVTFKSLGNADAIFSNPFGWEGSIWRMAQEGSVYKGRLYVFASCLGKFLLIDMQYGESWSLPMTDLHKLLHDFALITKQAKITVEALP